jgi:hypothetical protein
LQGAASAASRTTCRHNGARHIIDADAQPIDTGTFAGKRFVDMLLQLSETNLRREHQLEGQREEHGQGHGMRQGLGVG